MLLFDLSKSNLGIYSSNYKTSSQETRARANGYWKWLDSWHGSKISFAANWHASRLSAWRLLAACLTGVKDWLLDTLLLLSANQNLQSSMNTDHILSFIFFFAFFLYHSCFFLWTNSLIFTELKLFFSFIFLEISFQTVLCYKSI